MTPQDIKDYSDVVTVCELAGIGPVLRAKLMGITRATELRWRKGTPVRNREKYNLCLKKGRHIAIALGRQRLPLRGTTKGRSPEWILTEVKGILLEILKEFEKRRASAQ